MSANYLDKPYDLSIRSLMRGLILILLPLSSYILAMLPIIFGFFFIYDQLILSFHGFLFYFMLSILLVLSLFLLIIVESFLPCIFIKIFKIQVKPGEHKLHIKDNGFFHHMLFFALYRPALNLLSLLPLIPLRSRLVKLAGLTIGKTSLLAGTELIDEPYAVTIGEHTLIGGFTTIYAHISHKTLKLKPITIGNNCFIGNKSVIMPGAIIEDNVIVEPGTVVKEEMVLKKGKTYAGNPAEEVF